jgi:hypothetical protein
VLQRIIKIKGEMKMAKTEYMGFSTDREVTFVMRKKPSFPETQEEIGDLMLNLKVEWVSNTGIGRLYGINNSEKELIKWLELHDNWQFQKNLAAKAS